jgi:hypothetical protein
MSDRSTAGVRVLDRPALTSNFEIAVGLMLVLLTFSLMLLV